MTQSYSLILLSWKLRMYVGPATIDQLHLVENFHVMEYLRDGSLFVDFDGKKEKLKVTHNLPPDTTDEQLLETLEGSRGKELREFYGLKEDATHEQLQSAHLNYLARQLYGLHKDATDDQLATSIETTEVLRRLDYRQTYHTPSLSRYTILEGGKELSILAIRKYLRVQDELHLTDKQLIELGSQALSAKLVDKIAQGKFEAAKSQKVQEDQESQEENEPMEIKMAKALIECLRSSYQDVRFKAVIHLSEIYDKEVVKLLISRMKDEDISLRCCIASTLGLLGDISATSSLIEALNDKDPGIRSYAATALEKLIGKDPENDKIIIESLSKHLDDEDLNVKWTVSTTLSYLGNEDALKSLVQCLYTGDEQIRYHALESLVEIKNEKTLAFLQEFLNRDMPYFIRAYTILALGNLALNDMEKAEEIVTSHLNDEEEDVRNIASQVIDAIKERRDK